MSEWEKLDELSVQLEDPDKPQRQRASLLPQWPSALLKPSLTRMVGALGSIPFYVSSNAVQTIRNVTWSGAGTYAAHNRIGYTTLVEATGSDADMISFEMLLSRDLGVNPWNAIKELLNAERNQTFLELTIGDHGYGRYRWLIASHSINLTKFDYLGNLTEAVVSIKLVEYLRE